MRGRPLPRRARGAAGAAHTKAGHTRCTRACRWRNIEQPKYLRRWIDLSAVWFKHSSRRGNLRSSVEAAGLAWEGRAHSAIDDARNTARWVPPLPGASRTLLRMVLWAAEPGPHAPAAAADTDGAHAASCCGRLAAGLQ